ncbi:ankyrin repeat domain-containing protein [Aspergillus saccharolyticus JOP 1030-1]|uniref:C2H2-type domain-containing protein n=1 Tax=Aspergillus saccharolyticus JOP 1030-1 TaxID=1450539 RepID=A0A318Z5Q9_9EURO|nr:hypothetical protein BP01DRAFT_394301 [Aspergillus saccharolyticus JOP 1030-1]PYH42439.1 hypothetical protein BP01DRAFT_394301 [Aspergillus saccharolyticus JOP 1030-1]
MADPISITSIIIDISDLISRLLAYAKGVRQAAADIRRLSEELFALNGVLEHLKSQYEGPPTLMRSRASADIPESLRNTLRETNESVQMLLDDLKQPTTRLKRVKQQLAWPFTRTEYDAHLARLERVKSWLILIITSDSHSVQRDLQADIADLARTLKTDLHLRRDEKSSAAHKDLLQWLVPVSPVDLHHQASKARTDDTGRWFLDHAFKDWLQSDVLNHRLFSLLGKSGIGKTTLFSHIVDELVALSAKDNNLIFAYFYCKFGDAAFQEPVNILGSLVVQLSTWDPSVLETIWPLYEATAKSHLHRQPIAISALEDALIKHTFDDRRVIILIDAINENPHHEQLIHALMRIATHAKDLRILMMSTTDLLPGKTCTIHMNASLVRHDIDKFIPLRLQQDNILNSLSQKMQHHIWETLLAGADGSFRWTQLSLDNLSTLRTAKAIREVLKSWPMTLRETYVCMLGRISPNDWELARNALFWLTFSKDLLTLPGLNEAVMLDEACTELDEDSKPISPQILLHICQGLIAEDEFGRVNLSHASVAEFLTSDWIRSSSVGYFSLDPGTAEQMMMRLCLTYLCLDNFRTGYASSHSLIAAWEHEHPFLNYAAQNWGIHARACSFNELCDRYLVNKLFSSRCLPNGGNYGTWLQALLPEAEMEVIQTTHPLYYAASFGLVPILEEMLTSVPAPDVNACGGRYGSTPLFVACWRKQFEAAELLLQAGADPYLLDEGSDLTILELPLSEKFAHLLKNPPREPRRVERAYIMTPETNIVQGVELGLEQGQEAGQTAADPLNEETHGIASDQQKSGRCSITSSIDRPPLEMLEQHIRQLFPALQPNSLAHRFAHAQLHQFDHLLTLQIAHLEAVCNQSCQSGEYCLAARAQEVRQTLSSDFDDPTSASQLFPSQFECCMCFQLHHFQTRSAWLDHVHADLKSYICTFHDCTISRPFNRKSEWIRHETQAHWAPEWWECPRAGCSRRFFRKDIFYQHLLRSHEPLTSDDKEAVKRVRELIQKCRTKSQPSLQQIACRFCGVTFDEVKRLLMHVSSHLENLALSSFLLVQQHGTNGYEISDENNHVSA